jgi:S-adenosylmethionine-diacylglycerol 3-amino-3-carboxypropyl transferase
MQSEAAARSDFSRLRYAQCWEDADILLEALDVRPGHVCLSIASAGDNTLALLSRHPARVIALDLSPAQIACLELRIAAYRELSHQELLQFMGSLPGTHREDLYRRCRVLLSPGARRFWDAQPVKVVRGIGGAGRFERYFALFRSRLLPLLHPRERVERLLRGGPRQMREAFYDVEWNSRRWRLLFRIFFSRFVMARLGRDPGFFRYVEGGVAGPILERTRHALTTLNPAENPYLQWILTGRHLTALPYALRPENFELIRTHLDRLEYHCCSLEEFLETFPEGKIDRFNLSDIFEYMSWGNYHRVLEHLVRAGRCGGRLAYWNLLAERRRPADMGGRLRPMTAFARRLHQQDKAFFYRDFIVEEIV